jgi:hypothetical protein
MRSPTVRGAVDQLSNLCRKRDVDQGYPCDIQKKMWKTHGNPNQNPWKTHGKPMVSRSEKDLLQDFHIADYLSLAASLMFG